MRIFYELPLYIDFHFGAQQTHREQIETVDGGCEVSRERH